jgi:DNA-binding transcriptional LysR family regulator
MPDLPPSLNLDQVRGLRAFTAAAQHLSFTRAAAELDVSPQAVAAAVARLERTLGVRLLNRSTRSMSLTGEGARLQPRAADALERLRDAMTAAAHGETPAGRVRLSVAASFARRFVLPALPRLAELHPALEIELALDDSRVDLIRDGFDIAIRGGVIADAGVVSRPIAPMRAVLVASPRYLARAGVPTRSSELAAHRLIGLRLLSGAAIEWPFVERGVRSVFEPAGAVAVSDPEAVAQAAAFGLGIGAVAVHHALPLLRAGRLRIVLHEAFRPMVREIALQYPHREHLAPRVRAVVEHLLASFTGQPDLHAKPAELRAFLA